MLAGGSRLVIWACLCTAAVSAHLTLGGDKPVDMGPAEEERNGTQPELEGDNIQPLEIGVPMEEDTLLPDEAELPVAVPGVVPEQPLDDAPATSLAGEGGPVMEVNGAPDVVPSEQNMHLFEEPETDLPNRHFNPAWLRDIQRYVKDEGLKNADHNNFLSYRFRRELGDQDYDALMSNNVVNQLIANLREEEEERGPEVNAQNVAGMLESATEEEAFNGENSEAFGRAEENLGDGLENELLTEMEEELEERLEEDLEEMLEEKVEQELEKEVEEELKEELAEELEAELEQELEDEMEEELEEELAEELELRLEEQQAEQESYYKRMAFPVIPGMKRALPLAPGLSSRLAQQLPYDQLQALAEQLRDANFA